MTSTSTTAAPTTTTTPVTSPPAVALRLVRPSPAEVSSTFGTRWGRPHTGVDFDADAGSPAVAAGSGRVVLAGWKNGYGYTVVLDHGGGIQTLYGHLDGLSVALGEEVAPTQLVGTVGATGNVTGPNLHFEVVVRGVPEDPLSWI